jgi:cytoskeleton protein RodZ
MNEPDTQVAGSTSHESLGKLLAETRKARGWTAGYAANQLRLPESTVLQLEAEEFSLLPGEVYVRGYLRNYARLLRLPSDEVVAAYLAGYRRSAPSALRESQFTFAAERRPSASQPMGATSGNSHEPDGHHESSSHALLWAALVIAAAYGLTWWWPEKGISLDQVKSQLADTFATNPQHADIADTNDAARPAAALSTSTLPSPSVPQEVNTGAAPMPANSTDTAPPPETTTTPDINRSAQAPTEDILVLDFRGDSWATVFDASGNRLMNQTGAKGSSKTLKGKAPFKLTIGRVSEVTITMNGTTYTLPNAEKRATEKFSVPFPDNPQ